jgi:hypothetical protein
MFHSSRLLSGIGRLTFVPRAVAAIAKAFRSRGKVDPKAVLKAKKGEAAEDQMSAFDRALDAYFSRT